MGPKKLYRTCSRHLWGPRWFFLTHPGGWGNTIRCNFSTRWN
jgi:hypothetical protein